MITAWTNLFAPEGGFKYDVLPYTKAYTQRGRETVYTTHYPRHTTHFAKRWYPSSNSVDSAGWRNPSTYTRVVMEAEFTPGHYEYTSSTGSKYVYDGYYRRTDDIRSQLCQYPVGTGYQCLSSNEENKAVTECLLKLKDQKVDLGTMLAESVKTADLLAETASDLWSGLLAIKRGRFGKRERKRFGPLIYNGSKDAANAYLKYKYAWKPLLSEINSLYELSTGQLNDPREKIFSASRTTREESSRDMNTSNWVNARQKVVISGSCKLYARLSAEFIANAGRYGLTNPLAVGWEVIPYSFLIDWGIPVGNYLQSLNATGGLTFHGGYSSTHMEGSVSGEVPHGRSGSNMGANYQFKYLSRKRLNGFPSPMLYATSPFSTNNVKSAIALFRQLV